jgi:hypothetical protein
VNLIYYFIFSERYFHGFLILAQYRGPNPTVCNTKLFYLYGWPEHDKETTWANVMMNMMTGCGEGACKHMPYVD